MSLLSLYNLKAEKIGEREAVEAFLKVAPKKSVIHQVSVAQAANARNTVAHTKDRSEVRGGGRKPWRQKGTGRARQGSIRSPQWRGGGIVFGPTSVRNYHQKVNKKMKQKALFMVLTDKLMDNKIFLLENLPVEKAKTKEMNSLFQKLPCEMRKVMIGLPRPNAAFVQAIRNLPHITAVGINSLNVKELLECEYFVTTEDGMKEIGEIYKRFVPRSEL